MVLLSQGVIVLSRQWKNILYTPLLLEHNFKTRHNVVKPLNVTFAIPDADDVRRLFNIHILVCCDGQFSCFYISYN